MPGIAVQAAGLVAIADPSWFDDASNLARNRAGEIPDAIPDVRREVISIAEAISPAQHEKGAKP